MKFHRQAFVLMGILPFAGCISAGSGTGPVELSESVLAVAAPGQDVSSVQVQEDGCYWWRYEGVVEETYIPLETRDGRMICTRGDGTPISEL